MTPEEVISFRDRYAKWPTDRLARAATLEKGEYEASAVALMLEELQRRDLAGGSVETVARTTPPLLPGLIPERDTWLFPARLNRRRYAIRNLIFFSLLLGVSLTLELVPRVQPEGFIILMLAGFVYSGLGLLLPRSKDAGLSPRLAILFALIPATTAITFITLFFVPSKK